jgi:hypothetical protein
MRYGLAYNLDHGVKEKMIEWIVILLIILCIFVLYYSQSVSEYSISQITESQISTQLLTVWEERKPVVISERKPRGIWASEGLKKTRFWGAQPIWGSYQENPNSTIIQSRAQQLTWADILGISQIENDTLLRWFNLWQIYSTRTEAHIGPEGLRQCYGWATAITCTEGEARCILLHNAQKARLPPGWKSLRWKDATVAHHPLWTQVKYIEILLRPSTVLLVPPHWVIAIEPLNESPIWWTRTDIHHPVSQWAQRWNERD